MACGPDTEQSFDDETWPRGLAFKLVKQGPEAGEGSVDLFYWDRTGDRGIDVARL